MLLISNEAMIKYITLYYLKNKKGINKKIKNMRKGFCKSIRFMIRTYQNLEFFQINKTLTDRAYLIVLLLIFLFQFSFPKYSGMAYETAKETIDDFSYAVTNSLPVAKEREFKTIYVTATAYASVMANCPSEDIRSWSSGSSGTVTLITSITVVTPLSTLFTASSRNVFMPSSRAWRRISVADPPRNTMLRHVSLMSMSS